MSDPFFSNRVSASPITRALKISERVARQIVLDIVRRGLKPGDSLPTEAEMLSVYGVGRASLREALRLLEVQGLVTIRPGPRGGPVLSTTSAREFGHLATLHFQFSGATFGDLHQARRLLEPVLAAEAAIRQDHDAIARMNELVEGERGIPDDDFTYKQLSNDFHRAIVDASGNRVLGLFAESLAEVLRERVATRVTVLEARTDLRREHKGIARAITNGNATRAHRLVREHLEHYSAAYIEKQRPGFRDTVIDWV
jgi:GntR family transcriptional regulator, transcriptional repressor for pyruvate dehydrogenase complex